MTSEFIILAKYLVTLVASFSSAQQLRQKGPEAKDPCCRHAIARLLKRNAANIADVTAE